MKKSIVFGALALAGAAFAVESATVGYTSKDVGKSQYILTAVQFDGIGGTTIDNVVTTTDTGTQAWTPEDENVDGWEGTAATIMVPNAAGLYDYYYYASDGYDDDTEETYPGWCDEYGYIKKNVALEVGFGVWTKGAKAAGSALTFSGMVPSEDEITVDVDSGYTIIANPLPQAFEVQKVTTTAAATQAWTPEDENVPNWEKNAATIMVPNAAGLYDYYYYASDGYDDDTEETYPGWCDEYGYIQKNKFVAPGVAVWFKTKTAASVTFAK